MIIPQSSGHVWSLGGTHSQWDYACIDAVCVSGSLFACQEAGRGGRTVSCPLHQPKTTGLKTAENTSRKQPCVAAHPGMWLKAFIPCQFWIETGTVGSFCRAHTRPRGLHCCFPLLTQREITLGCLDTQNHSHQNRTLTTLQYLHHYATSLSKPLALQRSTVCLHFPLQYIESGMPYYTAKDRSPAAVFIGWLQAVCVTGLATLSPPVTDKKKIKLLSI